MSRFARLGLALAAAFALMAASAGADAPAPQVRAVYRTVLLGEYFGPASAVCSHLSAAGVHDYTAGGASSCAAAFAAGQHVLRHKTPGDDNSGYSASQYRQVVRSFMAHLTVTVKGNRASAVAQYNLGQAKFVRVAGRWLINSYPPDVGS